VKASQAVFTPARLRDDLTISLFLKKVSRLPSIRRTFSDITVPHFAGDYLSSAAKKRR
jgi:hypothetical protein